MKLVELLARLLIGGVAAPVMMMFSLPVQSQAVVQATGYVIRRGGCPRR